jgi:hypothetical protein
MVMSSHHIKSLKNYRKLASMLYVYPSIFSQVQHFKNNGKNEWLLINNCFKISPLRQADIKKLKDAGLYTIQRLFMTTKKDLMSVKGMSEAKVDKVLDAANKTCVRTTLSLSFTNCHHLDLGT